MKGDSMRKSAYMIVPPQRISFVTGEDTEQSRGVGYIEIGRRAGVP
jgi:hypothetical protein